MNTILIENNTFYNSTSLEGGALYAKNIQNLKLYNNTFTECISTQGSAAYLSHNQRVEIKLNTIKNNAALKYGAGLAILLNKELHLLKNKFLNNISLKQGGALYLTSINSYTNKSIFDISDNLFLNNTSEEGAAIHMEQTHCQEFSKCQLRNNTYTKNIALGNAIFNLFRV